MAAINSVTLVGRVVRDLEIRTTESGKMVSPFALAVDGYNKDADASFIDCVAWGKAAEILQQYAPKGKQIGITGRLQTRTWEKDGVKRKATEVVIDQFQLLGSKGDGSNTAPASERHEQEDGAKTATPATTTTNAANIDIDTPIDLSEIPF